MKLNRLVGQLAVLGLAAHAGVVLAQSEGGSKLERVEVTGSSIKRIKDEGALPIQVISRKDIERQGIVSAEQLIATLSVNGNGLDNLASNADVVAGAARGNNGASSANLRGQGAASTLVLLNGRRVAAHGLNGGVVDLNSIPMSAIERVEILKDGASAIYGTDAIGGVINFILRKNYSGLEAEAFVDATEAGGGNIGRVKLTGGFGDLERDRFNVLASIAYSDVKMLRGDQRDFVNTFQASRGLSVDTRGTPYATVFAISSLYSALSRDNVNNTGRSTGPIQPGTTVAMNGINVLDLPGQAGCASVDGQAAYDEVLWASPGLRLGHRPRRRAAAASAVHQRGAARHAGAGRAPAVRRVRRRQGGVEQELLGQPDLQLHVDEQPLLQPWLPEHRRGLQRRLQRAGGRLPDDREEPRPAAGAALALHALRQPRDRDDGRHAALPRRRRRPAVRRLGLQDRRVHGHQRHDLDAQARLLLR
jgi:hypothetical protein